MADFIKKIKNIFKNSKGISIQLAHKIQRDNLESIRKKQRAKEVYTPSYVLIGEQVHDESDQVFKAAIFNITQIAFSNKKYVKNILNMFDGFLQESAFSEGRKEYVSEKIVEIKQMTKGNHD